jgi:hypothetical protein
LQDQPEVISRLINGKYIKGMQAVHQVMCLGNLRLIDIVVDKLGGDISQRMSNDLTAMHCAA